MRDNVIGTTGFRFINSYIYYIRLDQIKILLICLKIKSPLFTNKGWNNESGRPKNQGPAFVAWGIKLIWTGLGPVMLYTPGSMLPHQLGKIGKLFKVAVNAGQQGQTVGFNRFIFGHNHNGIKKSGNRLLQAA